MSGELDVIARAFNAAADAAENAADELGRDPSNDLAPAMLREIAETVRTTPERLDEWDAAVKALIHEIVVGGVWPE